MRVISYSVIGKMKNTLHLCHCIICLSLVQSACYDVPKIKTYILLVLMINNIRANVYRKLLPLHACVANTGNQLKTVTCGQ